MKRTANNYQQGINYYVPGAGLAADLNLGGINLFSLGKPVVSDDDIVATAIDADAVAGTREAYNYTSDSPFGRNLILTVSGAAGNAHVIDVYGFDYLGQPMIERFTGAAAGTAVLYGKKAFYRVTATQIVTASTNAITAKLGTGSRLGLPYKGDIQVAKENDVFVPLYTRDFTLTGSLAAADIVAGRSLLFTAPCPGFVKRLIGIPSGAGSTTNAASTVEIATVAVTGLTVTMDQDTQTVVTDEPTTVGYNANNRFVKDTLLEIVHAATTSGGPCSFGLELTPTQFVQADVTDPATALTGDPRGTYEPLLTLDGTKEIVVGMLPDPSVNANERGGLYGIAHFGG